MELHFKEGNEFVVKETEKHSFWKDGFVIVRNLLTPNEIRKLRESLEDPNSEVLKNSYEVDDGDGKKTRMCLWNHPGKDLTGVVTRSRKIVNTCESLLDGEVYHYHSKLTMKEAFTGGAFQWHQDYGYWYNNGLLFPDMVSVQMAIDDMDMGNGCLQVLKGSHKLGRIDHGRVGEQAGAEMERVEQVEKVLERVPVELKAGDGLFFHCNLLHRSNQNKSSRRRWSLISCYNMASNNPVYKHHHAQYTPIDKVPDSEIMKCDELRDMSGKWFVNPTNYKPEHMPQDQSDGRTYGTE